MQAIRNTASWVAAKASQLEAHIAEEWLGGWTPALIPDLTGKVALVTGGNSGMGFQTARKLAENGAQVLLVSRDPKNGQEAASKIRNEFGKRARVEVLQCDLSSLKNVVALAREVRGLTKKLDIVVLNAGIFHPGPFATTGDGIEQTLAVNYYAHALLVLSLLDLIRETPKARVIFMSSPAETFGKLDWGNLTGQDYKDSGMTPYGTSKLYMMMFSKELADRIPEVKFFCVHPGLVATPLQYKAASWRYWSAALVTNAAAVVGQTELRGAYSTLYAATSPELEGERWTYVGPNSFNLWPTHHREAYSKAVYNPPSYWKLFENTVQILRQKVGSSVQLHVPRHPDDVHTQGTTDLLPKPTNPVATATVAGVAPTLRPILP